MPPWSQKASHVEVSGAVKQRQAELLWLLPRSLVQPNVCVQGGGQEGNWALDLPTPRPHPRSHTGEFGREVGELEGAQPQIGSKVLTSA